MCRNEDCFIASVSNFRPKVFAPPPHSIVHCSLTNFLSCIAFWIPSLHDFLGLSLLFVSGDIHFSSPVQVLYCSHQTKCIPSLPFLLLLLYLNALFPLFFVCSFSPRFSASSSHGIHLKPKILHPFLPASPFFMPQPCIVSMVLTIELIIYFISSALKASLFCNLYFYISENTKYRNESRSIFHRFSVACPNFPYEKNFLAENCTQAQIQAMQNKTGVR